MFYIFSMYFFFLIKGSNYEFFDYDGYIEIKTGIGCHHIAC